MRASCGSGFNGWRATAFRTASHFGDPCRRNCYEVEHYSSRAMKPEGVSSRNGETCLRRVGKKNQTDRAGHYPPASTNRALVPLGRRVRSKQWLRPRHQIQIDEGRMLFSDDPRAPESLRGRFLSIRRWRSHTKPQVGTPEAFPRLGLRAIAAPSLSAPKRGRDKNDCTVREFQRVVMSGRLIEVYLTKARSRSATFLRNIKPPVSTSF
jgi:hypothetical protein